MSFTGAADRLQQAVFSRLGEDAQWEGVEGTVRVRRREHDEDSRYGEGSEILTVRAIRVRRSEVPEPAEGNQIQILDAAGAPLEGGAYRVSGEPECDRKGVWRCPVEPA
jgi:hypothetical protein